MALADAVVPLLALPQPHYHIARFAVIPSKVGMVKFEDEVDVLSFTATDKEGMKIKLED
ncbi:MAG: hypothetical protein QF437_22090 [Planctomycetota bacterium]|jgi:hypothetical protein|nr:hypothetical protein [Planctomycetota bacterium]MDP7133203.1 hypothetical protein [Planctomycetota bacterium]MDP7251023.1 hypothetical protein [Planctomycetota bacterium]